MKILKAPQILIVMLSASLTFSTGHAQSAEAVAKVNGITIPQARADALLKSATAQGQPESPDMRNRIRDILVNQELISQEAVKKGLDKNAEVNAQIQLSRQQVLFNAYMQDYMKANPITEDVLKKEYETAKTQLGDKEYKVRHILVKQEDEAKQLIAQLKKGTNFEKLAAQKSEDPGSKDKGGDLDWISPASNFVKPFMEAVVKLKKGQLTDTPVQSQFGWHVIRLDDERPAKIPAYDDVKGNIMQQLQGRAIQKVIADLRAKAKIE